MGPSPGARQHGRALDHQRRRRTGLCALCRLGLDERWHRQRRRQDRDHGDRLYRPRQLRRPPQV